MNFFHISTHVAKAAELDDIPALQAFFEANPAYTRRVEGSEVAPDAAQTEFHDDPPPEFAFDRRWMLLVRQREGARRLRLNVVDRNLRGVRFWRRQGCRFVRLQAAPPDAQGASSTI